MSEDLDRALPKLPDKTEDELRRERSILRLKEMEREGSRWFDQDAKTNRDMTDFVKSMESGGLNNQIIFRRIQEAEDLINGLDRNDRQFTRNWNRLVDKQDRMIKNLEERLGYSNVESLGDPGRDIGRDKVIDALLSKVNEYVESAGSQGDAGSSEGDARRIDSVQS